MVKESTYGEQMVKNMKENGSRDTDMDKVFGKIQKETHMKEDGSMVKQKEKVHLNGFLEIYT